jgi:serine/threonine-protein kinase HipA
MLGLRDGVRGSYPELVDALSEHGAQAHVDAAELYRRMTFNVLISNVDDHSRNHGFSWTGTKGWTPSPAYDLNPTPSDVRPRVLSTNISLDDGTCDIGLVLSVAEYFGLSSASACAIIKEVASVTVNWRDVARATLARPAETPRVESALQHGDLMRALAL